MKQFFRQLFQDKNGGYSLREVAIGLFVLAILISWVAAQFYSKAVPEFIFYVFSSLVAAGCFGYSLERKSFTSPEQEQP